MKRGGARSRRGVTLVEVTVSVVVLAVIAAIVAPALHAGAGAYAEATAARRAVERAAFALERCTRLFREAPLGTESGTLGIASASGTRVEFTDGRGVELADGTLWLLVGGEPSAPIARDVQGFAIEYLGDDGATDTSGEPASTHRVNITIRIGGMELRGSAFPRVLEVPT